MLKENSEKYLIRFVPWNNIERSRLFVQDLKRFLQEYCILLQNLEAYLARIIQEFHFVSTWASNVFVQKLEKNGLKNLLK